VLFVAVPLFAISLIVEHWLSLDGRLALIVKLSLAGAIGVAAGLIVEKTQKQWRQRRAAEAVSPGSRNSR